MFYFETATKISFEKFSAFLRKFARENFISAHAEIVIEHAEELYDNRAIRYIVEDIMFLAERMKSEQINVRINAERDYDYLSDYLSDMLLDGADVVPEF